MEGIENEDKAFNVNCIEEWSLDNNLSLLYGT